MNGGIVRLWLLDIIDYLRSMSRTARLRRDIEFLLAAWNPPEGSVLRWSLEWLARNTDRNTNA